jgi:hypothetical protein
MKSERVLALYYLATFGFVLLDYGLGINVRVAFLEARPDLKAAYYGFCLVCLVALFLRPSWTILIGTFETMVTLVALILSMALRVMVPNDAIIEQNAGIVTPQEIVNFLIGGFAAYFAWLRGIKQLKGR